MSRDRPLVVPSSHFPMRFWFPANLIARSFGIGIAAHIWWHAPAWQLQLTIAGVRVISAFQSPKSSFSLDPFTDDETKYTNFAVLAYFCQIYLYILVHPKTPPPRQSPLHVRVQLVPQRIWSVGSIEISIDNEEMEAVCHRLHSRMSYVCGGMSLLPDCHQQENNNKCHWLGKASLLGISNVIRGQCFVFILRSSSYWRYRLKITKGILGMGFLHPNTFNIYR